MGEEGQRRPEDQSGKDSPNHWLSLKAYHLCFTTGLDCCQHSNILQGSRQETELLSNIYRAACLCSQASAGWVLGEGKENGPIRQGTWLLK